MFRWLASAYFTSLTLIFLVVFVANVFVFGSMALGAMLLICFFALVGFELGGAVAPGESHAVRIFTGIWTVLSVIAIVGSISYYAAAFTQPVAVTLAILLFPLTWLVAKRHRARLAHDVTAGEKHHVPAVVWVAMGCIVALLALTVLLVAPAATTDAIRSVWDRVPASALATFGAAALLLAALLLRGRERTVTLPLASGTLLVLLSVALLVFPLGYGFDPFIHRATESHIAEFGTITPKPFYYIGQYAIVLFLHFVFLVPIDLADKLLLPLATALLLPFLWFTAAAHLLREKREAAASLLGLFLLPLASFIVTTPQGLANLWTLLTFLCAIPRLLGRDDWPLWPVALGALATLAIHPIAGIPVALFLVLLAADPTRPEQKFPRLARAFTWITVAIGSLILPISFVVNAKISGQALAIDWSALSPLRLIDALHLNIFFENRFSPLLDFVYLFAYNQTLLLLLGTGIILWIERKQLSAKLRPYALLTFMLLVNFMVMRSAVQFSFLIDYERSNYADRLIPLALFATVPFLILIVGRLMRKTAESPLVLRAFVVALAGALMTASFYLTYPRHDDYETSHGFNVAQSDIDAVLSVDGDAGTTNYVVLANQTVSSAAIQEMGFVRYYGDLFYYPIPTGGPLYQDFLSMNDHPNLETVAHAMDLGHVDQLYYLVNNYWWESDRIVETAKTNADAWWSIGDGAVYVFKYVRK